MAGKIFVNYRRDDAAANALNVAQYLEREFGSRNVFLDIDRMRAGQDFPSVLKDRLAVCKVMIAVIGPTWLKVAGDDGKRRLDDPEDWVRLEIAHALERKIAVIPVLVGGAVLPKKSDLPDDLKPLLQRHVATITTNGFRNEMAGLARDIRAIPGEAKPWGKIAAGVAALALGGYVAAYQMGAPVWWPRMADKSSAIMPAPPDQTPAAVSQLPPVLTPPPVLIPPPVPQKGGDVSQLPPTLPPPPPKVAANAPPVTGATIPAATDPALSIPPGSGKSFRDCPDVCPEMVVVPKGEFMMGSNENDTEKPPHKVTMAQPFAVGKYAVTFAEWDACVAAKGCKTVPKQGWRRGRRPVINVSWDDAKEYAAWLSKKTGKAYRLLTEAEFEYAARAGTTTKYPWGDDIGKGNASCDGCGSQWDNEQTAPVGSFKPNPWGLYDMHGNVWQWTEDCWHDSYIGAPKDEFTWTTGCTDGSRRVVRGGSWNYVPRNLRSAYRDRDSTDDRSNNLGFRVGRTLGP